VSIWTNQAKFKKHVPQYEVGTDICVKLHIREVPGSRRLEDQITEAVTERHGGAVNIPASYSGGVGFKYRRGDRLS
jgi:hypothetical protein